MKGTPHLTSHSAGDVKENNPERDTGNQEASNSARRRKAARVRRPDRSLFQQSRSTQRRAKSAMPQSHCPGELVKDLGSLGRPRATGFDNQRHKGHALLFTNFGCVKVPPLHVSISTGCRPATPASLNQDIQPLGRRHGEINAVGRPWKEGKYRSAGRRLADEALSGLCGSRSPARSVSGWSPAFSAQPCTRSRKLLCLWLRSPLDRMPVQHSNTASQRGHQASWLASGTPSRARTSETKWAGSMRVRPAGKAVRKAPPPGSASESKPAFAMAEDEASWASQPAASNRWLRSACRLPRAADSVTCAAWGSWALKAATAPQASGEVPKSVG